LAIAAPIPREPPVINAILFWSLFSIASYPSYNLLIAEAYRVFI
jgi:hypothetical protein